MRRSIVSGALRAPIIPSSNASYLEVTALYWRASPASLAVASASSPWRLRSPLLVSRQFGAPRLYSSSSPQPQAEPSSYGQAPNGAYRSRDAPAASAPASRRISRAAANPPSTTRAPPLDVPVRQPDMSTFSYLFAAGKAYLNFYKTGLKNIYVNAKIVWALPAAAKAASSTTAKLPQPPTASVSSSPSTPTSSATSKDAATIAQELIQARRTTNSGSAGTATRAEQLLVHRHRHDIRRLPIFALMLLVFGEFTPLVVIAVPRVVPLTCRIPGQAAKLQKQAEERRRRSFAAYVVGHPQAPSTTTTKSTTTQGDRNALVIPVDSAAATAHMARSLDLVGGVWDRMGWTPGFLAAPRVRAHAARLAVDDALLLDAGGVRALEPEEAALACAERGIDVLGRSDEELRAALARWLRLVAGHGLGEAESARRMRVLWMAREAEWPEIWA